MNRCAGLLVVILVLALSVSAQEAVSDAVAIHSEIQRLYDFHPHSLDSSQIDKKSALLDQFWSKVTAHQDIYVPGLRRELADFNNPQFFLYDGSKLLLSLSHDPADRKLALAAIAHSDLRDIQLKDYFLLVHGLAAQGEDTTEAAFHILSDPKFQVFIPQHFLTLAQNYCLIYMLFPTDQAFWLQPAIERLQIESDETAQQSLLLLLWYAQTPESDRAIGDFSNDATKPASSRAAAAKLLARTGRRTSSGPSPATSAKEQSLRQKRRDRMKSVSDEALTDFDEYTAKIIAARR